MHSEKKKNLAAKRKVDQKEKRWVRHRGGGRGANVVLIGVDFFTGHDRCCDAEAAPRRPRAWG